jgi:hydroxymethylpyrimidine/phosphomethylpyrimidine kinase
VTDPALVSEPRPAVLLVGGHDPSGGAGVTQDVSVARNLGIHPLAVLTTVAVQNVSRVRRRSVLSSELVRDQLDALAEEFQMGAVKTGLLGSPGVVETLADWLGDRPRLPLVVDPVPRASNGGDLAEPGTAEALVRRLLPRARVLTPNLEEASRFLGTPVGDRDALPGAAQRLRESGPDWVLIKGGHLPRGRSSDFLCGPDIAVWLEEERRGDGSVRGTGCALATALACGLAAGATVPDAARSAKQFVTRAIDRAYRAGKGRFLDSASFETA